MDQALGLVSGIDQVSKLLVVFGMRFGIEGVLQDFLLDLGAESAETRKGLKTAPSSALGS